MELCASLHHKWPKEYVYIISAGVVSFWRVVEIPLSVALNPSWIIKPFMFETWEFLEISNLTQFEKFPSKIPFSFRIMKRYKSDCQSTVKRVELVDGRRTDGNFLVRMNFRDCFLYYHLKSLKHDPLSRFLIKRAMFPRQQIFFWLIFNKIERICKKHFEKYHFPPFKNWYLLLL